MIVDNRLALIEILLAVGNVSVTAELQQHPLELGKQAGSKTQLVGTVLSMLARRE